MSDSRMQCDRVLAAMAKAGPAGITQIDFDLPNVCDGLAPIKRVAARIHDLEHKRGVTIRRNGRRHKCCVYVLESVRPGTAVNVAPAKDSAVPLVADAAVSAPTTLPLGKVSMYDPYADAA